MQSVVRKTGAQKTALAVICGPLYGAQNGVFWQKIPDLRPDFDLLDPALF